MAIFERNVCGDIKPLVFGEGPKDAKIVIVGEAPGATESMTGRPFTGESGRLLDRLLSQAGIQRSHCYLTNVVKEQPPGNDISYFIRIAQKGVVVTDRYKFYEEMLYKELYELNPNVICPLGLIASYALTRRVTGITKIRGSILNMKINGRFIKVIPSLHPSYIVRGQYLAQYQLLADLMKVASESLSPEYDMPDRKLQIRPTFIEIMAYLNSITPEAYPQVAFDIEVANREVSCFSFARSPLDAISIPLIARGDDYMNPVQEVEVWRETKRILEDPRISIVGQNLSFDSSFIFSRYGIAISNMEDTMIAQAICDPDSPKGLDFICSIHTKEPYYKDEGKEWFKFQESEETFWGYNAKDSAVCLEALPSQLMDLKMLGNEQTYRFVTRLIPVLAFMQVHGIKVDVEGMKKASIEAEVSIATLEEKLTQVVGRPLNAASPKQLMAYFYDELGIKPYINLKTHKPTTDDKAMNKLARKGIKAAQIIRDIRHIAKRKGTYYDMKVDADSRLRSSYNPVGAESGRLSSSKNIFGTGGNMQNMPLEMKPFLLFDEGYVGFNVDLSQAENRIVAYIAPEPSMIHAFESGIDIHRQTAGLIFGIPMDQVSDEDGSCDLGGGLYSQRFWGKKANHGLNYDLGYKTFAALYDMPEKEAKFIVDAYHRAYPGVREYHAWIKLQLNKNRIITNLFGRKRVFRDRWGDQLFKAAYSYIPQSTVGEKINRHGLVPLYEDPFYGPVEIMNQVHDSIVFQIPLDTGWPYIAAVLLRVKESLSTPIQWGHSTFSIPSDCKMGLTFECPAKVKWDGRSVDQLAEHLEDLYNGVLQSETHTA